MSKPDDPCPDCGGITEDAGMTCASCALGNRAKPKHQALPSVRARRERPTAAEENYHNRQLLARRRRAVTTMLVGVAECIKTDAGNPLMHEETASSWPTSFFRAAMHHGVQVDVRLRFSCADLPVHELLNEGLKCQAIIEPECFEGCGDIPLEAKLILDIPDLPEDDR